MTPCQPAVGTVPYDGQKKRLTVICWVHHTVSLPLEKSPTPFSCYHLQKKKNSFTSESLDWGSFVCFGSMWVSGLMASVLQGSKQSSLVPVSRWWGYRAHRPSHWLLCLRSSQVRGWEALQPKKVICVANQQNPTTRKVRKDHTDLGSCRQKNKAKFGHSSAASLWAHRLAVCTQQAEVNRPREE